MANQSDLEFTYSLIDRVVRLSVGEMADFSGAKYDGDFSLSLEHAQRRKPEETASMPECWTGGLSARVRSGISTRSRASALSSISARSRSGVSANTVCFERLLVDHYRMAFEKV